MSKIQCSTGSSSDQDIYRKIEAPIYVVQNGWNDICSFAEGSSIIISKANKSINIVEYIDTKLELEYSPSNAGWNYKTFCPFHKNGNERTPSFFINKDNNRYYCQACGVSGGVVEFISKTYNRPQLIVAEHILRCVSNEDFTIEDDLINKIKKSKEINSLLLQMSELHREFISQNNDEESLEYVMKIMKGFDLVYIHNTEKVEENIVEIVEHFKMYLKKYQE